VRASITSTCVSADGQWVVGSISHPTRTRSSMLSGMTAESPGEPVVFVWRLGTGELVRTLGKEHGEGVVDVCITADSQHIISLGKDHSLKVWTLSMARGELVNSIDLNPPKMVRGKPVVTRVTWLAVCVTPDSQHIVTAEECKCHVWSFADGSLIRTLDAKSCQDWHAAFRDLTSMCLSPNGEYIVTAAKDRSARVWRLASGEHVCTMEGGHADHVQAVCCTPNADKVCTASRDGTVQVWRLTDGEQLRTCEGHRAEVTSICASADSQCFVTTSKDQTVRVWLL